MNHPESSRSAGPSKGSANKPFPIPEELVDKSPEDLFKLAKGNIRTVLQESRESGRISEDLVWIDELLNVFRPINEYYNPQAPLKGYLNRQANSTSFDPRVRTALIAVWLGIEKMKERNNTIYEIIRKVRQIVDILTPTHFNRSTSRSIWEARRSRKTRKSRQRGGKTRRRRS